MPGTPDTPTIGSWTYGSIDDASRGLLCEVADHLTAMAIEYIVIGGWCPVLRNGLDTIMHPGTKDVDVLFRDAVAENRLHDVVRHFIGAGYLVSAKHDFQLLRVLSVGKHQLVFNVDLLHPSESAKNPDLFVKHFEFDIPEDNLLRRLKTFKSMVLPSSSVLFEGFFDMQNIEGVLPDGRSYLGTIPLMDEAGLILSKCESMKLSKRPRDAFDVYLMVRQESCETTIQKLRQLCEDSSEINDVLTGCVGDLKEGARRFDVNVKKYWIDPPDESPAAAVMKVLEMCLSKDGRKGKVAAT